MLEQRQVEGPERKEYAKGDSSRKIQISKWVVVKNICVQMTKRKGEKESVGGKRRENKGAHEIFFEARPKEEEVRAKEEGA